MFQMQSIELIINKLNENMRRRSGLATDTTTSVSNLSESSSSSVKVSSRLFFSPTDAVSVQISKLRYVVEELEILINDNFLQKKNDLLSRGNQTEDIIEENQGEQRKELRAELDQSKLKLKEMENENAKNKVVVGGLCEKVN